MLFVILIKVIFLLLFFLQSAIFVCYCLFKGALCNIFVVLRTYVIILNR